MNAWTGREEERKRKEKKNKMQMQMLDPRRRERPGNAIHPSINPSIRLLSIIAHGRLIDAPRPPPLSLSHIPIPLVPNLA